MVFGSIHQHIKLLKSDYLGGKQMLLSLHFVGRISVHVNLLGTLTA